MQNISLLSNQSSKNNIYSNHNSHAKLKEVNSHRNSLTKIKQIHEIKTELAKNYQNNKEYRQEKQKHYSKSPSFKNFSSDSKNDLKSKITNQRNAVNYSVDVIDKDLSFMNNPCTPSKQRKIELKYTNMNAINESMHQNRLIDQDEKDLKMNKTANNLNFNQRVGNHLDVNN